MTKLSWIRGTAILLLLLSFQATAENDGVVSLIADELDISSTKAKGGAGAIFAYVKDNLDADDFADIADGATIGREFWHGIGECPPPQKLYGKRCSTGGLPGAH